jgi:hypothetical protein
MPLANGSFVDLNGFATWNCSVSDIQLADNKVCDVILQTRVANHEHAGNSNDLFTKQCVRFTWQQQKYYPKVKIKAIKVKYILTVYCTPGFTPWGMNIINYMYESHSFEDGRETEHQIIEPGGWVRGLRHEMSSHAQILGSWVRASLEASIDSRVVLSCVGSGLCDGLITHPKCPTDCL